MISQTVSYALLGQAAIAGAYVPVPFLVRSIGQSIMASDGAKKILLSGDILDLLEAEVDPADPTQLFDTYLFEWWTRAAPPGFISGDQIEQAYAFHITKVILNSYDNCCGSSFSSMGTDYVYLQITRMSPPPRLFHPGICVPPQPVGLSFSVHWTQQHIFSGN